MSCLLILPPSHTILILIALQSRPSSSSSSILRNYLTHAVRPDLRRVLPTRHFSHRLPFQSRPTDDRLTCMSKGGRHTRRKHHPARTTHTYRAYPWVDFAACETLAVQPSIPSPSITTDSFTEASELSTTLLARNAPRFRHPRSIAHACNLGQRSRFRRNI